MTDVTDANINEIVYDRNDVERRSWNICNTRLSRSFTVFACQVFVALFMIVFSCIKLYVSDSCEENQIFIALLSSAVGYFLPNPKL